MLCVAFPVVVLFVGGRHGQYVSFSRHSELERVAGSSYGRWYMI